MGESGQLRKRKENGEWERRSREGEGRCELSGKSQREESSEVR